MTPIAVSSKPPRRAALATIEPAQQFAASVGRASREDSDSVPLNIVSLVLRVAPSDLEPAQAAVMALPGAECHGMSADGKLVVTVESADAAKLADTLVAIHHIPQVQAATLAYEHRMTTEIPCKEA